MHDRCAPSGRAWDVDEHRPAYGVLGCTHRAGYRRHIYTGYVGIVSRTGTCRPTLAVKSEAAENLLATIASLGIDLETVDEELQQTHLEAADKQYQALIASVIQKLVTEAPGY